MVTWINIRAKLDNEFWVVTSGKKNKILDFILDSVSDFVVGEREKNSEPVTVHDTDKRALQAILQDLLLLQINFNGLYILANKFYHSCSGYNFHSVPIKYHAVHSSSIIVKLRTIILTGDRTDYQDVHIIPIFACLKFKKKKIFCLHTKIIISWRIMKAILYILSCW